MNDNAKPNPTTPRPDDEESPGLPGFRTWRGVYGFVIGCFIAYVVLLAAFTRWFS